jgi:prephenate dehydrogenase
MPGPDELERMAREAPRDPEQERLVASMMSSVEELTGKLAAAHPELAADVFRSDESDLEYFQRRLRETRAA